MHSQRPIVYARNLIGRMSNLHLLSLGELLYPIIGHLLFLPFRLARLPSKLYGENPGRGVPGEYAVMSEVETTRKLRFAFLFQNCPASDPFRGAELWTTICGITVRDTNDDMRASTEQSSDWSSTLISSKGIYGFL